MRSASLKSRYTRCGDSAPIESLLCDFRENYALMLVDLPPAHELGRTLAAHHLHRLASEGLLTVAFARRSGRTGPGAGRPAKLYARAERELALRVPPRDYGLAARLLADVAAADGSGDTLRSLVAAAAELGREIAAEVAEARAGLEQLLRDRGYEPSTTTTASCGCATAHSTQSPNATPRSCAR